MTDKIIKRDNQGKVFAEIDKAKKKGKYFIRPGSNQYKFCNEIHFTGFDTLPSGLYKQQGNGLTGSGYYLLEALHTLFNKKLVIRLSAKRKSRTAIRGRVAQVTINHSKLVGLNKVARLLKQERNEKIRSEVRTFLIQELPGNLHKRLRRPRRYLGGTFEHLLGLGEVHSGLTTGDKEAINQFIPDYLSKSKVSLRDDKKLRFVLDSIEAGRVVYLRRVIKEFEKKLKSASASEATWQKFLANYILLFRTVYGEVLEKESVSLQGKFPDFMLIDPYSYLDIYEIKKPQTTLLAYDASRGNYYWDRELAKAISQVENYIYQVQRNSDGLINDVRKSKGIEISIVKPRGYIIAGCREQFKAVKMADDFRILNDSLKNVDILFYDDLLNNLRSFVGKLSR